MTLLSLVLVAVWIAYDGLHDAYDHADVALVPGYAEIKNGKLSPALQARLDHAVELYNKGVFPAIVVSGVTTLNENDESDAMSHYLHDHQVPASAIIEDHRGTKAGDTMENLAKIMQEQKFHSVLLITTYYRLTRLKLALRHDGVQDLEQAHLGVWNNEDIPEVVHEEMTIYDDVDAWYVHPAVKEASDAITQSTQNFKDTVNKGLDTKPK